MKKVLLLAAFGVAGMMSANTTSLTSTSNQNPNINTNDLVSLLCVTTIYRVNADGSQTVIKTDVSLQPDERSCRLHAQIVLMDAQLAAE
ncbi:hypothetical protein [Halpernia sp.]|uniref:hypothetical protein n=1 Tax=Halpernia sp. TaxID=2782209 RepID=UPI003A8F2E6D